MMGYLIASALGIVLGTAFGVLCMVIILLAREVWGVLR